MQIAPTEDQVNAWVRKFVPEKDLFFLREKDLKIFEDYLDEVLVIPIEEFFNHTSYMQIQITNSYMTWTLSSKTDQIRYCCPT